ncbi:MAG: ComEC family competence protein [Bacteroidetes bacterium]|nr:ComEC family competence protein [Bacteroidota bacterium]
MKNWQRYPFVRLLIPFVGGIVAGIYSNISFYSGLWIFTLSIPFLFVFHYFQLRTLPFSMRHVQGVFVTILSIGLGIGITGLHNHQTDILHFENQTGLSGVYRLKIEDVPAYKTNSIRFCVRILSSISHKKELKCDGKVMVYFQPDKNANKLRYGDQLIAQLQLNPVESIMNPNSVDYKKYLSNQGIYHRTYLPSSKWILTKRAQGFNLYRIGTSLQEKFINLFKNHHPNPNELTVASALVLGYDNNIEPELRNAYTTTGALHILSVSGMHVGVIYLVLSALLISLKRKTLTRIIRGVILLTVVWFYALITGLSPAVLRSAVMLSFIIVGECGEREQSNINTLAASAFILLIIDPFQITNIGFQLSYLAVAGIVLIEPLVRSIWSPKFRIVQLIWGLTTVSIAAQVASSPLSLYYFHQFPNYFIFTNYIAIPLSSIAIYAGMLTLITTPFIWLSHQLAQLFFGSVALLNYSIQFFSHLPYASIKNIQLTSFETILIYLFIFLLYRTIKEKQKLSMFGALCCFIIIGVSFIIDNQKSKQQQMITIYSIKSNTVIDYFNGKTCISFQSFFPLVENQNILYQISGNRIAHGIKQIIKESLVTGTMKDVSIGFWKSNSCYLFKEKRLIVQNGNWNKQVYINSPIVTDMLLLTRNPYPDIEALLSRYNCKQVILDATNNSYNVIKWKRLCNDYKIPCHYTASDGAFIFNTK